MKVAILIPTRNDRPILMDNCLRMMKAQTLKTAHIEIVDDAPKDDQKDISKRYRLGYDRLRNKGFDVIALIENDDWYAPTYLETMVANWAINGKPDLYGTDYTFYYHLKLKAWFIMKHPDRASAMNTLIKPDLDIAWCKDNDPYTDLHLWKTIKNAQTFSPGKLISIGMKHGDGFCGGRNHIDKLERYVNTDPSSSFLFSKMVLENHDHTSYHFYKSYGNVAVPALL